MDLKPLGIGHDVAALIRTLLSPGAPSDAERPVRLRFGPSRDNPMVELDGLLLVQRAEIHEAVFAGLSAHLTCLSPNAALPLEALLGVPVEIQLVTDRGGLRRFCALVSEVRAGPSDGGLALYQFSACDALAVMERRVNSRVFRRLSVVDISEVLLREWRQIAPGLARAFDYDLSRLSRDRYPVREFSMQHNESDAAFLRRSWRRAGIGWVVRPSDDDGGPPLHTLVLFDDAMRLDANAAGELRYHRDEATEARDAITQWLPERRLVPGAMRRQSWDYREVRMHDADGPSILDQGVDGNALAAALRDSAIEMPHAGDSADDHIRLARLRLLRHEGDGACVRGASGVRDLAAGEWNAVAGHPSLDGLQPHQCEYLFVDVLHQAENNLPKQLDERAQRLLDAGRTLPGWRIAPAMGASRRYANLFTARRRDAPLVPPWNPAQDLPPTPPMTGLVVGPPGEEVYCDALGRVKVQFQGLEPDDHAHAQGAGAADDERSSAWLRVDFGWAGAGWGSLQPLRAGMEVGIQFLGGDPDRPVVTGAYYNARQTPPCFSHRGGLPGNRYLSGVKTKEIHGGRCNQLRFDDTAGQISAQLASEHGDSQLNLGWLTQPRIGGSGMPRGEGAELRSDASLVMRGGQGVLISSAAQANASGPALGRGELIGLTQALQAVVEQLATLSDTHRTRGTDPEALRRLLKHLQDWENGANTAPDRGPAAGPIVAVSAPAGMVVGSGDGLLLEAQTQVDIVSAGHAQLSAGQQIRQRAEAGISLFAHGGGVEAVAGQGPVDVRAHDGDIHLTASRQIVLTAGTKVVIQAPEVQLIGQGAQTQWGAESIVEQASRAFVVKAPTVAITSGGNGVPEGVKLPTSRIDNDELYVLQLRNVGTPLANRRYRIELQGGGTLEGRSDATGRTALAASDAIRIAIVSIFDD